jgi:hypothetical protein
MASSSAVAATSTPAPNGLRHLLDTNRTRPPQDLVNLAVDLLARDVPDDVVAFAIHLSDDGSAGPRLN